jgi:hypothetical protein
MRGKREIQRDVSVNGEGKVVVESKHRCEGGREL